MRGLRDCAPARLRRVLSALGQLLFGVPCLLTLGSRDGGNQNPASRASCELYERLT